MKENNMYHAEALQNAIKFLDDKAERMAPYYKFVMGEQIDPIRIQFARMVFPALRNYEKKQD